MFKKLFLQRLKINQLQKQVEELMLLNTAAQGYAYLVGIERNGRINRFIFRKNGNLVEIETMGILGDNIPEWKKLLLDA